MHTYAELEGIQQYIRRYMEALADNPTDFNPDMIDYTSSASYHKNVVADGVLSPSIVASAIELYPISQVAKWYLQGRMAVYTDDIALQQITSSVKRYLYHIHGAPIEPVVFRKWRAKPRTVIALFPALEGSRGQVLSYEHIGQHGGADWGIVTSGLTALATPEEYKDLKEELESIGYRLKVYKRWTRR